MPRPTSPLIKDVFNDRLVKRRDRLTPGALSVAEFIDANKHGILGLSAREIGIETNTSDATVIRTIQTLGFAGLRDLKDTLASWLGRVDSPVEKMAVTSQTLGSDADAAIEFTIQSQRAALEALGTSENRAAAATAIELIATAKSVGLFGIAASGIIAQYGARLFSRSGIMGKAYTETGVALAESLLHMQAGDVLIMILHSRAHREATATLAEAQRLDIPVIMILGREDAPLRVHAAASIVLPRFKADNVALHSQAMFALEALHLGASSITASRSVATLERLVTMRKNIRPYSR